MKLNWRNLPRWASCLIFTGLASPAAWAQQNNPQTSMNAEVRIVTSSVDAQGNPTNQVTTLTGQDALDYIRQQQSGQRVIEGTSPLNQEIEITMIGAEEPNAKNRKQNNNKTDKQQAEIFQRYIGDNVAESLMPTIDEVKKEVLDINKKNCQIIVTQDCSNRSNRPALGVALMQKDGAVIIEEVIDASAAKEAGLQNGDMVLKINDQAVADIMGLQQTIRSQKIGDAIKIEYSRNGKIAVATAKLQAAKAEPQWVHHQKHRDMTTPEEACKRLEIMRSGALLGVFINNSETSGTGALVTTTIQGTSADKANLKTDDVIVDIDGKTITNYDELHKTILAHKAGDRVAVTYSRNGKNKTVKVRLSSSAEKDDFLTKKLEALCAQCQSQTATETAPNTVSDEPKGNGSQRPENTATLDIFPNPAKDVINLNFQNADKSAIRISVTNLEGKELMNEEITDFSGVYQRQLDLSAYPAAAYLVTITQGNIVVSKQVVLQK